MTLAAQMGAARNRRAKKTLVAKGGGVQPAQRPRAGGTPAQGPCACCKGIKVAPALLTPSRKAALTGRGERSGCKPGSGDDTNVVSACHEPTGYGQNGRNVPTLLKHCHEALCRPTTSQHCHVNSAPLPNTPQPACHCNALCPLLPQKRDNLLQGDLSLEPCR